MNCVLHSATPAFGARAGSPFATKAESLFVLAGVPYERLDTRPDLGPRGKLPFLTLPDGSTMSDSWNIQKWLEGRGLQLADSPVDTLVCRLIEEHLYFAILRFRWTYQLDAVETSFFGSIPWPIRPLVMRRVRAQVRATLHGQGIGRRPEDEVLKLVLEDLEALKNALGDAPHFGQGGLSIADVAAHGILNQVMNTKLDDPLIRQIKGDAKLSRYHDRVDAMIYGGEA